MPPLTVTLIVGLQVAELSPVMPLAVTAAVTAVRFVGLLAVYVAVPTFAMAPAV